MAVVETESDADRSMSATRDKPNVTLSSCDDVTSLLCRSHTPRVYLERERDKTSAFRVGRRVFCVRSRFASCFAAPAMLQELSNMDRITQLQDEIQNVRLLSPYSSKICLVRKLEGRRNG